MSNTQYDRMKALDLSLTYEQAAHGIQSAIGFMMNGFGRSKATDPKHMQTGIDLSKSDTLGLVNLLIDKGVFTSEEYLEYIRVAANVELHNHERSAQQMSGDAKVSFR